MTFRLQVLNFTESRIFCTWSDEPFGLLTMVVSLEAIFLSTFVMISQNRADEKRQALADQQWQTVQDEGRQNERLLQLSDEILELTKAVHATTTTAGRSTGNGQSPAAGALQPDRVPVGAAMAPDPRWSS